MHSSCLTILMVFHWTCSSLSMSFLCWGAKTGHSTLAVVWRVSNRGENRFPRPAVFAFLLTESSVQLSFTTKDNRSLWTCPPRDLGPFLQSYFLSGPCPHSLCSRPLCPRAALVEFREAALSPFFQPIETRRSGNLTFQLINHAPQFHVICKLVGECDFPCFFLPCHPWGSTKSRWVVWGKGVTCS